MNDRRRRIRDELQRLMNPNAIKTKQDLLEAEKIEDREIQQIAIKDWRCPDCFNKAAVDGRGVYCPWCGHEEEF